MRADACAVDDVEGAFAAARARRTRPPRRRCPTAAPSPARAAGATAGPGSTHAPPPAAPRSQCASCSARALCACMRTPSVSRPFSTTQALNGDRLMPALRITGTNFASIRSSGPHTAPAMTRPWPSRYLVPEWMTRSAPSVTGRCSAGLQKQLSTASSAPPACAISASAAMSQTSVSGLVGVSANSSRVVGVIAARHAAGSVCDTKLVLDAELREVLEQLDRRAEHALRAHHVVAGLQQAQDQHQDRRHAARRCRCSRPCPPAPPGGAPSS